MKKFSFFYVKEPSKPKVESYEQNLIETANKNPYFNAILFMMMAANKSKLPEQKYLLSKSFGIFFNIFS